ncbi:MAG: class II fructose-bisphosphate aldolase [Candidatus Nealsonbacteria bacterium]|nr:class II fructose-bisphosphate aldolase [Candidatus Nealsonbacteria bacterium]
MKENIEKLVYELVFENNKEAAEEIKKRAKAQGIKLASTYNLYKARAKNEWKGFSVPAFNIRTLTFDTARAVFRQVLKKKVGAFIFEIARSEISYTDQKMSEYVPVILAAGIKEGFKGNLFFQGDHFQIKAEKFFDDKQKQEELSVVKKLIKESIEAGAYNIDLDCSTLVKLDEKDLREQQKYNFELTALLTSYVREIEPKNIVISIGGEVGEIGGKNSTPKDLKVFVEGYNEEIKKFGKMKGLIKIAVQTGATHGGIVLPSGEIKKVDIDFETLNKLSKEARKHGMGGAVQHGASTLPEEYFDKFVKAEAVEIHLATAFQNIVYDSPYFPAQLKEKISDWLKKEAEGERKPDQTEEQFFYKTRKKALGPFKKEIWAIPQKARDKISEELESKFALIFDELDVEGTVDLVEKYSF